MLDGLGEGDGGGSMVPVAGDRLSQVRRELNAWRYTERLIEQLDPGYEPGRADAGGFPG